MENKPVAWITEWDGKYSSGKLLDWVAHARGDSAKHTPLYTAPNLDVATVRDVDGKIIAVTLIDDEHSVKDVLWQSPRELSDEEIIEIGNAVVNLIDSNEGWIEFAKAILKKASER